MILGWKEIFLLIASCLMIIIVLLQDSKEDASTALTGEKNGLFANQKARGIEVVTTFVTLGIAVFFITFAILAVAIK